MTLGQWVKRRKSTRRDRTLPCPPLRCVALLFPKRLEKNFPASILHSTVVFGYSVFQHWRYGLDVFAIDHLLYSRY
jgi:hypothetical protein